MNDNYHLSDSLLSNHRVLLNILCNQQNGFKILHCNARSLNAEKLDYLRYILKNQSVDVFCVSETWFNKGIPDNVLAIDNFNLFINDRCDRRGGDVAIYCRDKYKARFVSQSFGNSVEYIFLEITDSGYKLLVGCVYNPHRKILLDSFFDNLASFITTFDFYAVCGDFNINMLVHDIVSSNLSDSCSSAGLRIVNSSIPTRFDNNSNPSLLDLFLVSDISAVVKFDQFSFISDHDLIFCCLNIPIAHTSTEKFFTYRDYHNINYRLLHNDLENINWNDCFNRLTVNDKLIWSTSTINLVFERHVPIRTKKVISEVTPWFTSDVLSAIKTRNRARSKWKKCPSLNNWNNYILIRNETTRKIKVEKKLYFNRQLTCAHSSKEIWENLRKLRIINNDSTSCTYPTEMMNQHFSTCLSTSQTFKQEICDTCSVEHPFRFMQVNEAEVTELLLGIKSNAVGHDNIPIRFVKLLIPYIIVDLTHIINHCFTTSIFPNMWKISCVTPIPKCTKPLSPSDFRPISILPALAKVIEKIMAKQINEFLDKSNLLSPLQSGFRSSHSCSTALMKILEDVRTPFDRNDITLLCLLDCSKAFDSVNHELLCWKLANYFHFDHHSVRLMFSYLTSRLQSVRIKSECSGLISVKAGVPQGSILGPLLFSMFLNDIFYVCKSATAHAYADDVQLYVSGDPSQ